VTAPERNFHEAIVVAARAMVDDARDEAAALAMAVEDAGAALEHSEVLEALGALADRVARLTSLTNALEAADLLLRRARGGGA
jgi:hypothetical protein